MIYYWIPPPLIWNMTARSGCMVATERYGRSVGILGHLLLEPVANHPKFQQVINAAKCNPQFPKTSSRRWEGWSEGWGLGTIVKIRFWLMGTMLIGFRGCPIDDKRHRLGLESGPGVMPSDSGTRYFCRWISFQSLPCWWQPGVSDDCLERASRKISKLREWLCELMTNQWKWRYSFSSNTTFC